MTTRWLVLGAAGMLGTDLCEVVADTPGMAVTAATRSEVDVRDPGSVRAAVAGHHVVVNAAAWTDVDGAEAEPERAMAHNGDAVAGVAQACAGAGAVLLHLSTDYVFAGDAERPYAEDAPTAPLNHYGESKRRGEEYVLGRLPDRGYVIRTAWLYGEHGHNFVATMLRLAGQRDTVEVVDDQHGQPTWTGALARRLVDLGRAAVAGDAPAGVYHGTCSGQTTWFDLARAVFTEAGLDPARVRPTTSARFIRPARRPSYSVLGHQRWALAGLGPMPPWRPVLAEALARPGFARMMPDRPDARSG